MMYQPIVACKGRHGEYLHLWNIYFRIKTPYMGSYDNYIEFNLTKNYKMNKLKLIINRCFILINTCIDLSGIVSYQSLELSGFWSIPFQHYLESINFELPPPQNWFPLESAQLVSPSLVGPNPLQVERIVSPACSRPCSRANHLQPAKQKLCLGPDSHHGQGPPQEGGGYCQLSLLCPHLPPPPLLGASHPHPRDGKVVN